MLGWILKKLGLDSWIYRQIIKFLADRIGLPLTPEIIEFLVKLFEQWISGTKQLVRRYGAHKGLTMATKAAYETVQALETGDTSGAESLLTDAFVSAGL